MKTTIMDYLVFIFAYFPQEIRSGYADMSDAAFFSLVSNSQLEMNNIEVSTNSRFRPKISYIFYWEWVWGDCLYVLENYTKPKSTLATICIEGRDRHTFKRKIEIKLKLRPWAPNLYTPSSFCIIFYKESAANTVIRGSL